MNITLHRAENQKNVIVEISTEKSKILLDGGISLEENEVLLLSQLQEQYSFAGVTAVFLSHYNTDHVTMARGFLEDVPVYSGKLAGSVATASEGYKAKKPFPFAGYYANGVAITAGDIKVTPFLVDDAVHEGYALMIEGEGKRVLYSGDYHANGRKSFEEMLAGLPTKVDALLIEGGTLTEEDVNPVTERNLEDQAATLMNGKKGPVFVLGSVSDFDRVTTIFHAAKRNKRVLLEDLYLSEIACAFGKAMPNPRGWVGVRAYLTTGYKPEHFRYKMFTELPRMSKAEIAEQKFVMYIRPSMKKYLKTLSQEMHFRDGLIINALPDISATSEATKEYLAFAGEKGLAVHTLRKSGHADAMAVKALIQAVNPTKIMPLECKNVRWFSMEYQNLEVVGHDTAQC